MPRSDPLIHRAHVGVDLDIVGPQLLGHDDLVEHGLAAQDRHAVDRHLQQAREMAVEVFDLDVPAIVHEGVGDDVVDRPDILLPVA